ncbi:interleukin-1 receptor-associated kinase 1-binding protein 1 [Carlito syrichta]|uniref:Interleukin-1 receptor-associated kinase 1-binding protein 1 n=1 Tax=Carlito syrichta TaxID=1868482 RepID=A0A3Q0DS90_CARSF|nr:interleukin-1 receptor-associated kinase 1-binding protein 1 [Carlito syrichta]
MTVRRSEASPRWGRLNSRDGGRPDLSWQTRRSLWGPRPKPRADATSRPRTPKPGCCHGGPNPGPTVSFLLSMGTFGHRDSAEGRGRTACPRPPEALGRPRTRRLKKALNSSQAENVTVTKDFRRVENAYHMEAEVCITFTEFGKMQNVCNFLVEKLDSSVVISPPQFYHTPGSAETLRRQACLVAVENARRKAQEVCNLVGQTLGKPLLIKEEETKEWEGQVDDHPSSGPSHSLTVQQKIKSATIHAASKVFITFEVKGKEKKNKHI